MRLSRLIPISLAATLMFFGSCLLFANFSQAQTFRGYQKQVDRAQQEDFYRVDRSINQILLTYINADDPVYWTDEIVLGHLNVITSSLSNYETRIGRFWNRASSASEKTRRKAKRAIRKVKPRRSCRGARNLLIRSRTMLQRGTRNYRSAWSAKSRANQLQTHLNEAVFAIALEVDPTLNGEMTDGYVDDVVYEFGTKDPILMPSQRREVDPQLLANVSDLLYTYDDELIPVVEMTAVNSYSNALRVARISRYRNAKCH